MSTSRGNEENIKLKQNVSIFKMMSSHRFISMTFLLQIEGQLNRLLTQLKDLEDMKDELDEEEYISGRQVSVK